MSDRGGMGGWAWRGILILAFASARAAAQPSPSVAPAWRVTTLEQVDLWYHGIALAGFGVAEPAALYDPRYAFDVRRTKQRMGLAATPLDRAARAIAVTFGSDPAFEIVHFLPLYFAAADRPTMLQALRTLDSQNGPPGNGRDAPTSRAVAALATVLPRPAQRTVLRQFAELLDDEWRLYLRDDERRASGVRAAQASAFEQRWNVEFAPALAGYLAQINRERGTIVLSRALGREGRTVERVSALAAGAIVAIAAPRSVAPEDMTAAAFDVVRELCFATVRAVGHESGGRSVEPVADEQASRAAAVRCGALVLQRYLPHHRAAYQARFLAVRQPAAAPDTTTDRFVRAFPLTLEVERRLARAIASP